MRVWLRLLWSSFRAVWVLSWWATTTLVVADIVQFRWPEECRIDLCHPFTREEIRRVLFFMKSSKALDRWFRCGFL